MPIEDYRAAATTISDFLKLLVSTGGLRLKYRITAGEGAADPDGLEAREIYVEIAGPDAPLVTQRNGELLRALEHVAAKMVRLEPEEHDRISFDSGNFKAMRAREMKMAADSAAERVRRSGTPYSFQPMSSRERRMLHLAFRQFDDLETESSGEGLRRFVVVYRKGDKHVPPAAPSFQRGGRDSRGGGRDSRGGGRGSGRGDDRRGGGRGDRRGPRGPRR
jgi:spoIIIJ-associated protein